MNQQSNATSAYLEDKQIISMFFDRDEAAILETDRKYGNYLLSVAYHILHDEQDCAECQNDTYLHAWNSIPPVKPQVFVAYLVKIIRALSINKWRSDRCQKRVPPEATESLSDFADFIPDSLDIHAQTDARVIGNVINRYLRHTSKRKQYVFLSRYYYFRPITTIAEALGVSVSTVKKDLQAIKTELRKQLESEGINV